MARLVMKATITRVSFEEARWKWHQKRLAECAASPAPRPPAANAARGEDRERTMKGRLFATRRRRARSFRPESVLSQVRSLSQVVEIHDLEAGFEAWRRFERPEID